MQKINVSTSEGEWGTTNGLVRMMHEKSGNCFHVALEENGDVEVYCAPGFRIVDLENDPNKKEKEKEDMTFKDITSHNSTASQREKVLALVSEFPFRTSRELAAKVNPDIISHEAIHKRLPELLRDGKVTKGSQVRECTVTGKNAAVWTLPTLL